MSTHTESAVYSPYGACELKATYQRNLLLGTLITTVMVLLSVGGAWVFSMAEPPIVIEIPPDDRKIVISIPPPPAIIITRREFKPSGDKANMGIIPVPVADSLIIDENVVIASRNELAELSLSDDLMGSGGEIGIEDPYDGFVPSVTDFVAVEIQPEMIYREIAVYPHLAQVAGLTGVVWVKALVDENGNVLKAMLGKTSGVVSLDESAVAAAFKCKYKPAIQNGRPVKVWVTYKYDFVQPE